MTERADAYADAIITIARREDALDAVDDELLQIAHTMGQNRELHEVLTNRQYPAARRLDVVDKVLEAAHPITRATMAMLIVANRVGDLETIAQRVSERAAEERERALAEVYVAVPLDQDRRERLREALEEATGKSLELKVFVDPAVLGGVRAKVGPTLIDGSVARRLEDIRSRLDS